MTSTGRRGYVGVDRRWLADERLTDSMLRLMLWLDSHSDEYLAALHIKRTADEIGWGRNRVARTLELLAELGLVSTEHVYHAGSGKATRITLHLDAWSEHDASRRSTTVLHDEAPSVLHGEAPTTSTPIGRNEPLGLVVPSETTRHPDDQPSFDTWWENYPKKQGKAAARKTWAKMTQDERIAAWDALAAWNRKAKADGKKYLPMASTWLNQQRWEDEDVEDEREVSPNVRRIFSSDLQANIARVLGEDTQGELER